MDIFFLLSKGNKKNNNIASVSIFTVLNQSQ